MKKLIITQMSEIKPERERRDGKVSRLFFTITASEAVKLRKNSKLYTPHPTIFACRNIWQKHAFDGKSAHWENRNLEITKKAIEKEALVYGRIITLPVEEFPVMDGTTGKQKKMTNGELVYGNRYTMIIFKGENIRRMYLLQNHRINDRVLSLRERKLLESF